MKLFATIFLLSLAGLGLTSPAEEQAQATCATCRQGCLRTDTGDCFPNWPESTCEIYRGVSSPLPSWSLFNEGLTWNYSKGGNGAHNTESGLFCDGVTEISHTQRAPRRGWKKFSTVETAGFGGCQLIESSRHFVASAIEDVVRFFLTAYKVSNEFILPGPKDRVRIHILASNKITLIGRGQVNEFHPSIYSFCSLENAQ